MNHSAENERELNRLIGMIRAAGIIMLLMHFYFYCHEAIAAWAWTHPIADRFFTGLVKMGLFENFLITKLVALSLIIIAAATERGKKMKNLHPQTPIIITAIGTCLYFGAELILRQNLDMQTAAIAYMLTTMIGFMATMTGIGILSRVLRIRLFTDIFNADKETFPQETRKIETISGINLPHTFHYNGKRHNGWINLNMVRGLLLSGSSGSGKTWYIIQHIIRQHIEKGHAMFIYDFKFDDLTRVAYNFCKRNQKAYRVAPQFYYINFDDLSKTHRCNPLAPKSMTDIADAAEAARSFLLGLNPEWIAKQGDFWIESAIAFMTALIWYLKKLKDGIYCTLAHLVALSKVEYHKLFSVMRLEPDIESYLEPFLKAYLEGNDTTLGNQMISLKIALARLSSPAIFYVVSGDDFTLDINNPQAPKIVCMGSSPKRSDLYGSVISLYISTMNRLVNKEGMLPCSEIFEEASTIYNHKLPEVLATGRSNGISITICIQGFSQMKAIYGRDRAEMLLELPANKMLGQQTGESAEKASAWIGRVMQERDSISINRSDTSYSQSAHLEPAVPVSRIARLSAGEFVGLVADDPDHPIDLKVFHGRMRQDNKQLARLHKGFEPLPVVRQITAAEITDNFKRIGKEVATIVDQELLRMMQTPSLRHLVIADIKTV